MHSTLAIRIVELFTYINEENAHFSISIVNRSVQSICACLLCFFPVCSALSYGIFAALGITEKSVVSVADSFSRIYHIPYVTVNAPPSGSATNYGPFMIYLRPTYHDVILALIRFYDWTNVYYIYDHNDGQDNRHFETNLIVNSQL